MNTNNSNVNINIAETYYKEMLGKNFEAMEKCLHPEIRFISPLSEMSGRNAVVDAAKGLAATLIDIKIRSRFSSDNEIMLAYDFIFPKPIGLLKSAVLMEFKDNLIARIELFFDARSF